MSSPYDPRHGGPDPYAQGAHGQPDPYAQGAHGQPDPYAQGAHGQPHDPYGQAAYGRPDPYAQGAHGQPHDPYGQAAYGQGHGGHGAAVAPGAHQRPAPYGPHPGVPGAPPNRPGVLVTASVLWVLNGLFLLGLGVVVLFARQNDTLREAFETSNTFSTGSVLGIGVAMALFGLAIAVLGVAVLTGTLWARLAVVLVSLLPTFFLLGAVIFPLFTLVAGVLQFLPQVNAYARAKQGRAA